MMNGRYLSSTAHSQSNLEVILETCNLNFRSKTEVPARGGEKLVIYYKSQLTINNTDEPLLITYCITDLAMSAIRRDSTKYRRNKTIVLLMF